MAELPAARTAVVRRLKEAREREICWRAKDQFPRSKGNKFCFGRRLRRRFPQRGSLNSPAKISGEEMRNNEQLEACF